MGTFIVQSNMINEKMRGAFILAASLTGKSEIYRDSCVMLDHDSNELRDNHLLPQLNDDLTGLGAAAFIFGPQSRKWTFSEDISISKNWPFL